MHLTFVKIVELLNSKLLESFYPPWWNLILIIGVIWFTKFRLTFTKTLCLNLDISLETAIDVTMQETVVECKKLEILEFYYEDNSKH